MEPATSVVLTVDNKADMLRFYTEVLGLKLAEEGQGFLDLSSAEHELRLLHVRGDEDKRGVGDVVLLTQDMSSFEHTLRRLDQHGVHYSMKVDTSEPRGDASRVAVVRDPEGNAIWIREHRTGATSRWMRDQG